MINKYFYNLSVTIVGIVTAVFILTTVGGLFRIPVNPWFILIPFIGGIYYLKKQSPENIDFLKQLLILIIIIMVSYILSISIWDGSYDGRGAHLATANLYKNGWLPVYQNYADFARQCHIYPASAFWGNCYLHFVIIIGANIYKLTNLIESAKMTNFVLLSCVFMYSFYTLNKFLPNQKFIPLLISTLIILNPVCIYQWFTDMVDLHIYFSFILLILTILSIETVKDTNKTDLFMFICSSLMLAMTKFTGCLYLFVICSIYLIYLFLLKRNVKKYIKTIFIIGGLIAVTGVNPFYTNFRDYGHPFYPLFGKNKIDILNNGIPYGFQNMSYFERFLRSNFSETADSVSETDDDLKAMKIIPTIKIPFTINIKSIHNLFYCAEMRIGGFGYFWSGILLLSLFYLPVIRFRNRNERNIFWLITAMILASTFSNPHCWWARYVPQFWLFPVFVLFFGLLQNYYKNKSYKILKLLLLYFVIFSFIVNSSIVLFQNTQFNLYLTKLLKAPFDYIDSVKRPKDKIYLMIRPAWKNMIIADSTIIPHLEEYYGKESIVYFSYDENKVKSEEFIPMQYNYIVFLPSYFFNIGEKL